MSNFKRADLEEKTNLMNLYSIRLVICIARNPLY